MAKLLLAKKRPKLGIQLPNAGDDNQSCRILTVLFIELIGSGFRSIISTVVLYSIQKYQFMHHSGGVTVNAVTHFSCLGFLSGVCHLNQTIHS